MNQNKSIYIGSDHAAFEYKKMMIEHLQKKGVNVLDCGTDSLSSCDYNDYAIKVCEGVLKNKDCLGILICGSGIGISMAANKVKGIRCGQVNEYFSCKSAVENNCNVIAFGARIVGSEIGKQIVDYFVMNGNRDRDDKEIREIEEQTYSK